MRKIREREREREREIHFLTDSSIRKVMRSESFPNIAN